MTLSIIVRKLDDIKHRIDEYVIAFIYFSRIKNEKSTLAKITREIHSIDNLKTNMLIDNDLIDLKKIVIDVINKFAHIESCDVIVDLEIKTIRTIVYERVHIKRVVNVSLELKMTILVHHTSISRDRDFLFESNELNLSFYAHLINFDINDIIVRNENKNVVYLSRNCRLERIIELKFSNVFHLVANSKVANLILRKTSLKHKIK